MGALNFKKPAFQFGFEIELLGGRPIGKKTMKPNKTRRLIAKMWLEIWIMCLPGGPNIEPHFQTHFHNIGITTKNKTVRTSLS